MMSQEIDTSAYRVLIVDDNQAIHDDLRKILIGECAAPTNLLGDEELLFEKMEIGSVRFDIDSAYQGQDGLAMVDRAVAEGRPYALAFVDVRMPPGWDGVQTILRCWKSYPELQVVICTAYSDYSWNDIVRQLGQSDSLVILKKPFDNIEVIQLAHALTKKWTVSCEAKAKRRDLERMVQEATAELAYQANHDALTGLPNRRLFTDRLEQAILSARRQGESAGLLYVDLDGFKLINDGSGHAHGDTLLREVVSRMKGQLRGCDTLARMGGDEFTLIAAGLTAPEAAGTLAERLREAIMKPFQIDGAQIFVTASIGISIYPQDGREANELLRNADTAMYEAKRRGKNRAVFFSGEIAKVAHEHRELEKDLRVALANRQFILHFQPEFELKNRNIARFEALLRWDHPSFGLVHPDRFIGIAEESGLIVPIGNWILVEACRTAKKWNEVVGRGIPVAVNVSGKQICQPDFIDTVLGAVNQTGLEAGLLELELTETAIVRDLEEMVPRLAQLRELGIQVSIDDFGTGYSSFSYLERLPVGAVKIDRSFVHYIEATPKARSLVTGMITLAHSIGLRVVVEGVETSKQLEALFESQADEVQGFLLGRPAPVEKHFPELAGKLADRGELEPALILRGGPPRGGFGVAPPAGD